jgi:hypothetical protein
MRRAMTSEQRCAWEDVQKLLLPTEQTEFVKLPCESRESLVESFWWLADPLYRDAGNARRVEQDARHTELLLRWPQDEKNVFDVERGGDAVAELIARYGWPSYTAWFGVAHDRNTSFQGLEVNHAAVPSEPYTSFEYAKDRLSTAPPLSAVRAPLSIKVGDVSLSVEDSSGGVSDRWWPRESFRPDRRIVALPDAQIVFLRRQSNAEIIVATSLRHPTTSDPTATYSVMLLSSPHPQRVDSLDENAAQGSGIVVLRGQVDTIPTILAVEAVTARRDLSQARLRLAVAPPPSLAGVKRGDAALSDLAVLQATDPALLHTPTSDLLQRLRPSLRFGAADRRIALFWEEYGDVARDSARYRLRVISQSESSLLRRMGSLAGVMTDASRALEVSWTMNEIREAESLLSGPVPARMRAVGLDLRALREGRYMIGVDLLVNNVSVAHSERLVELAK